jgi:cobalt-zinc-cadmium efflux system membrane fusion protein
MSSTVRETVVRQGGTVLVVAALAGVAWWGHRTEWKASRFSELFGAKSAAEKEDWCEDHNVPDSKCIACHPELVGADPKNWCKEHGVPEDECTTCHPELLTKGKIDDWCKEHGVPESQCTVCHPELAVKGDAPPSATGANVAPDPDAKPAANPLTCKTHKVRIQFASKEAVAKAGVRLEGVEERPMAAFVTASGEVEYDATRVARLAPRTAGTVWRVDAEVGRAVKQGDVLALVDAADAGRAKGELLLALAALDQTSKVVDSRTALAEAGDQFAALQTEAADRVRASSKDGFRTQSDVKDAEEKVAEARMQAAERRAAATEADAARREARLRVVGACQALANLGMPVRVEDLTGLSEAEFAARLRFLGIPESARASLDAETASGNLVPVLAPFDGTVVARDVTAGEQVDPGKALFTVADVRRMSIVLEVRQEDAARVAAGQSVVFRPDGDGDAVTGKVAWVSTEADERTRTVRVRADVENAGGGLRAHTFGTGRIVCRESPNAIAVPTEAVHWEGCCHVVFVRLTDEVFQTRKVQIGAHDAHFTEVFAGVAPGEVVATEGSHVLKSELLKSKLGAGCCAGE